MARIKERTFGQVIRERRRQLDLTQEEVARRIILETAITHLEDHRKIHAHKLQKSKSGEASTADSAVVDESYSEVQPVSDHLSEDFEDIVKHYQHRLATITRRNSSEKDDHSADHAKALALSLELVRVERDTAIRLRNEGHINDEVLRQIERELDLTETRLDIQLPD